MSFLETGGRRILVSISSIVAWRLATLLPSVSRKVENVPGEPRDLARRFPSQVSKVPRGFFSLLRVERRAIETVIKGRTVEQKETRPDGLKVPSLWRGQMMLKLRNGF